MQKQNQSRVASKMLSNLGAV